MTGRSEGGLFYDGVGVERVAAVDRRCPPGAPCSLCWEKGKKGELGWLKQGKNRIQKR